MDQSQNIYALLVGIAKYPFPVRSLVGSVNDVLAIENYLLHSFEKDSLHIRKLLNEDAEKSRIVAAFREHFSQAKEGDLVWFHFSGHGSRQNSAPELVASGLSSDGMDETLVCYDSRSPEGQDLADKELALLLEELADARARVVCTFDSCHSGNITRYDGSLLSDPTQWFSRQWDRRTEPVLLQDYLEGQYAAMQNLIVPEPPHLALSACERHQKAFEANGKGFFTDFLVEALQKLGGDPGISELYQHLRLQFAHFFEGSAFLQTPVVETYGGFPIATRLFSNTPTGTLLRKNIYPEAGSWWVSLGALDGLQAGSEATLTNREGLPVGTASITEVGPEKSRLHLPHVPPSRPLSIQTTQAIAESVSIFIDLPAPLCHEIHTAILEKCSLKLHSSPPDQAEILLVEQNGRLLMARSIPYTELCIERLTDPNAPDLIADAMARYVRWRRGQIIQGSGISEDEVDFYFAQYPDQTPLPGQHLVLQVAEPHERKKVLLMAQNKGYEPLWFTLLYFSRECGIRAFPPRPVPGQTEPILLYGTGRKDYFYLPEAYSRNTDRLRLLVTYEKPDWTLIGQDGLIPGVVSRSMAPEGRAAEGVDPEGLEWLMVDLWLGLERV